MNPEKKQRVGWYFYDFANSAFTTSVITVFLGPYLKSIAENAATGGFVDVFGIPVYPGSFFGYAVSVSVILQLFLLPFLGAVSDQNSSKKQFLAFFAYLGAAATIGMYFLEGDNYMLGGALLIIANLSFGASIVFYNAFLNDIASADKRDSVSSIGWAWGFFGGGILLLLNLILYSNHESYGLTSGEAVRICLCSAGVWWALFTVFPVMLIKQKKDKALRLSSALFRGGFSQLLQTAKEARRYPQTLKFLIAYLLYNDGVQAVIVLAAVFGEAELGLEQSSLIQAILMVQFVAVIGALLFNFIAKKTGTKKALLLSVFLWMLCLLYAYFIMRTEADFFILAAAVAIVLGGTQALSRSVFSLLIPKGKEAEYFGLYEVGERGTSWMGTFFFSLCLQLTHSYRLAIVSLIIFFAAGLIVLARTNLKKAVLDAGNELPGNI